MKNKEAIEVSKRIDAYIRGKLSKSEIDELWLLFLKNPVYYELFETELHLKNLIQKHRYSGGLITPKSDGYKKMIYWSLAAAATVIFILTFQYYFTDQNPELDYLALTSIVYHEMADGNTERSDDEHTTDVETDINRAVAVAYMLKEDESIELFRELMDSEVSESQRVRIQFNMAILYYNLSEYESARDSFISVTNSEAIDEIYLERAWWFLANTYLKLNNQTEAMEAILMVKFLNGRNYIQASMLYETLEQWQM